MVDLTIRDQPPTPIGSIWRDVLDRADPVAARNRMVERMHGILDPIAVSAPVQTVGEWQFTFLERPGVLTTGYPTHRLSATLEARRAGTLVYRDRILESKPTHLVADGTMHRVTDPDGDEWLMDNYEERPLEAFLADLAHTIHVATIKGPRIMDAPGTTSTFFPDPDVESTSVDGQVDNRNDNTAWSTLRDAATGDTVDDSAASIRMYLESGSVSNWRDFRRGIFLFDTSSLPDTDTIDDATFSLFGVSKADGLSITPAMRIVTSTPASDTAIVTGDYDQFGTVAQGTDVTFANLNTGSYTDWTFNATGEGNVSKTGISKFGCRLAIDADDSEPGSPTAGQNSQYRVRSADQAGTANDPKLVVNHSAAGGGRIMSSLVGAGGLAGSGGIAGRGGGLAG